MLYKKIFIINFIVFALILSACSKQNSSSQDVPSSNEISDFKQEDDNFYGTAYVKGYAQIVKVNEAFCEENCKQYDYLSFHVQENANQAFKNFLKENEGNSFAGRDSIGLGCVENGIISYENDSDEKGMQEISLDKDLSQKIISATKEKPITLKLSRLKYTSGRGAPTCYSHLTYVEAV